jgi:uncharacterized membrane protein
MERRTGDERRGMIISSFSGPLPPPETLARYEQVLPGSAERIFRLAESQSKHRIEMEHKVIFSSTVNERLGIVCGFIIALALIGGGLWIVKLGQPVAGSAAIITAIAGVVYSFRYAKKQTEKELDQSQEEMTEHIQE